MHHSKRRLLQGYGAHTEQDGRRGHRFPSGASRYRVIQDKARGDEKTNILKIVAVLAIVAALIVVAVYLMAQFEQTKPIAEAAMALPNQAADYVQNNGIISSTAITGGLAALSGVALSKIQSSAQKKVEDIKVQATSELDSWKQKATDATEAAKTQVTEATNKTTELQTQFDAYKAETEPLKNRVTSLEGQVQTVKDENAQFVMNLMSASNGALVTNPVDGKVYSVLKTPPEIQVR